LTSYPSRTVVSMLSSTCCHHHLYTILLGLTPRVCERMIRLFTEVVNSTGLLVAHPSSFLSPCAWEQSPFRLCCCCPPVTLLTQYPTTRHPPPDLECHCPKKKAFLARLILASLTLQAIIVCGGYSVFSNCRRLGLFLPDRAPRSLFL